MPSIVFGIASPASPAAGMLLGIFFLHSDFYIFAPGKISSFEIDEKYEEVEDGSGACNMKEYIHPLLRISTYYFPKPDSERD